MTQPFDCPTFYAQFGALVRRRRSHLGLTQSELASRVGLTRASIANIETGRQKVLFHQLLLMAKALELQINDLVPAESPPRPSKAFDLEIVVPGDLNHRQLEQVRQLLQGTYRAPKPVKLED